jgi:acyl carrier protein
LPRIYARQPSVWRLLEIGEADSLLPEQMELETHRLFFAPGRKLTRRIPMSVGDQVKDIIAEELGLDREKVKDEAVLQTDLGADSLDIVELVMKLEDNFDMKIPDEDAEGLKTVGDAISYIEANSNKV